MRLSSALLRPVPEFADMEIRLGPAGCHVDPVFQHRQRHFVGLVRDLAKSWLRRVCGNGC